MNRSLYRRPINKVQHKVKVIAPAPEVEVAAPEPEPEVEVVAPEPEVEVVAPALAPAPVSHTTTRQKATIAETREKRLVGEYRKICKDNELRNHIKLINNDINTWYLMIVSDLGCENIFKVKHGCKYPFEPPVIMCLTKNGVFQPGATLCTSFTHYHPEQWDPSMTNEKIYIGMLSYYHSVADGKDNGIGVISEDPKIRKQLAKESAKYNKEKLPKEISNLFYFEGSKWGECKPPT